VYVQVFETRYKEDMSEADATALVRDAILAGKPTDHLTANTDHFDQHSLIYQSTEEFSLVVGEAAATRQRCHPRR
jgi:20S proteasome alpha/beta subunit